MNLNEAKSLAEKFLSGKELFGVNGGRLALTEKTVSLLPEDNEDLVIAGWLMDVNQVAGVKLMTLNEYGFDMRVTDILMGLIRSKHVSDPEDLDEDVYALLQARNKALTMA